MGYRDYHYHNRMLSSIPAVQAPKLVALKIYEEERQCAVDTDIVASRHSLLDILILPFERTAVDQKVVKIDDQIFVESLQSTAPLDPGSMTGCNFAELMTSQHIDKGRFTPAKDNSIKYNTFMQHEFPASKSKVLISSEIKAVHEGFLSIAGSELELPYEIPKYSIELKCRYFESNYLERLFRKTLIQCYLAATEELVIGYRDWRQNLKYIRRYAVNDYLDNPKYPCNRDFLDKWFAFLTLFIKKFAAKNDPSRECHYSIFYFEREDVIRMRPKRLSKLEANKVVQDDFVKWRELLRNENDRKVSGEAESEQHQGHAKNSTPRDVSSAAPKKALAKHTGGPDTVHNKDEKSSLEDQLAQMLFRES